MQAKSEFPAHILTKAVEAKKALVAEGKTEEEISTSLSETFKYKEQRLAYFMAALSVAETNLDNLYRVRGFTFSEGEKVPENAVLIDEVYYVAEPFNIKPGAKPVTVKPDLKAKRDAGKKDRPKGPKTSPWGLSPEEIQAKKEASERAQAAKGAKGAKA